MYSQRNIIATTKLRNNYGAIQSWFFQYCDSNIGLFFIASCIVITLNPFCIRFVISYQIAKRLPLLFANAFKNSWKSDNYIGSNTEKNLQNPYKNLSKEIKSDNFCYLVKLSLLILFASVWLSVLCFFFDGSLIKVIALPTIGIAIVVALSCS